MKTAIDCWRKLKEVVRNQYSPKWSVIMLWLLHILHITYIVHITYHILRMLYLIPLFDVICCQMLFCYVLFVYCVVLQNKESSTVSYSLSISHQEMFTIYKHCEIAIFILILEW